MKWTKAPKPCTGEVRNREAFLWFPLTINLETRWLERARWEEQLDQFRAHRFWRQLRWTP